MGKWMLAVTMVQILKDSYRSGDHWVRWPSLAIQVYIVSLPWYADRFFLVFWCCTMHKCVSIDAVTHSDYNSIQGSITKWNYRCANLNGLLCQLSHYKYLIAIPSSSCIHTWHQTVGSSFPKNFEAICVFPNRRQQCSKGKGLFLK